MTPKRMTDDDIMQHIRSDSPLNQARAAFASEVAYMEQFLAQNNPSPIEMKRLEFEAITRIMEVIK